MRVGSLIASLVVGLGSWVGIAFCPVQARDSNGAVADATPTVK